MAAAALLLLYQEQFGVVSSLLATMSFLAFGWSLSWGRRRLLLTVASDLALLFAYTWSLGPAIHVVIRSGPNGYSADVGGNTFFQPSRSFRTPSTGPQRVGLFAGPSSRYSATSNGGVSVQGRSPPAWLASAARFAVPRPAWSNVRLRVAGLASRTINASDITPAGDSSWSTNPRGEIQGSIGGAGWFAAIPGRTYTISGDLHRADGLQGILVGVTGKGDGYGYLLAIRLDHRDARFYYWNNGVVGPCTCHHPVTYPVAVIPMVQRLLQFALPSVILALFLCLLAFAAGTLLLRVVTQIPSRDIPDSPRRLVRSLMVDIAATGAGAVGIVSAALFALNNNQALPTIEDTSTYIFQAKTLALGRLWTPVPRGLGTALLNHFFALSFTVTPHGHWFGKYPPGWPLLLSVGALFDKAWMVTPVVGGLSILLIYLIGLELWGRGVGIMAALLALSSPFMLSMSGSLLSQSATWLWCGVFAYLVIRWVRHADLSTFSGAFPSSGALMLAGAGFALGVAFATRQLDALALALPFLVCFSRRPAAILWVATGSIVPLGLFGLYNLALTGNALGNGYTKAEPWDRLGFGPRVGGPFPYEAGFSVARGIWNVAYDLEHLESALFGWPFFFALALVAVPFVLGRAGRWDWLLLASCLTVVIAYGAYWASGVTGGLPRYWYVILPWLTILAARGLHELYRWPVENLGSSYRAKIAGVVFPVLFVATMAFFDVRFFLPSNVLYYRNPEGAVVAAVNRAHLHHALIFQVQHTPQQSEFDIVFSRNSPLLNGNVVWARFIPCRGVSASPAIAAGRCAGERRIMKAFRGRSFYVLDDIRNRTTLTPVEAVGMGGLLSGKPDQVKPQAPPPPCSEWTEWLCVDERAPGTSAVSRIDVLPLLTRVRSR
ncbi:MAG TPA: hypothetical protein VG815_20585 [Chloroflexota bacterium]|jgi:hypothetical protein|nr:hypothetical protein [Chloroflexota bacterium]